MDVENKKGCMVTGMMSFSESELNELRKLRDNGEPLEPEELRAVNRKELFDRNRKPEPTASEPMPEPVAEPTPDTTIGATYWKVYETWLEQSKTGHPTERSIAEALGKTVSTIHHHVANMVRDGYLVKDAIREREYVLTGKPFNPSDREKRSNHRTRWTESVRKQSDSKTRASHSTRLNTRGSSADVSVNPRKRYATISPRSARKAYCHRLRTRSPASGNQNQNQNRNQSPTRRNQ